MPTDTVHSPPQAEFPSVIDNTMYERWKSCPHSFWRADIQGLRLAEPGAPGEEPRIRKSIHLHFGTVLAAGLEATRRAWHARPTNYDAALAAGADTISRVWFAEVDLPQPRTFTEEAKTFEACILAHHGYFREWPLDDPRQQVHVLDGKPCVEQSGGAPIPGTVHPDTGEPVGYAGRFDAVLNRDGQLWGLDDKTTGSAVTSESWSHQWRLRGQFTGYCWLAQQWGHPVEWFLIHGIQILKASCKFAEAVEVRPRWMVDRWLHQLQADVHTMCAQYRQLSRAEGPAASPEGPHPFGQAFGHACFDYNSPCQFQTLCAEPRPELFLDDYVIDRWDPLAVRGLSA